MNIAPISDRNLVERGYAPVSVNVMLSPLNGFFRFLGREVPLDSAGRTGVRLSDPREDYIRRQFAEHDWP